MGQAKIRKAKGDYPLGCHPPEAVTATTSGFASRREVLTRDVVAGLRHKRYEKGRYRTGVKKLLASFK